ncbi:MAG TPA: hypothetical protein ENG63_05000 [Candidatus Desulfofervidus auxilii]|uniref:Holliday junction resolvase RuvC n=1 Tax=Desulfofervidus auxilii TaxID=1621989 RepID=A0A7C0Y4K3_DESA2|nr:hypothetical protein [Candidatus Desulfofervidus auxilii]
MKICVYQDDFFPCFYYSNNLKNCQNLGIIAEIEKEKFTWIKIIVSQFYNVQNYLADLYHKENKKQTNFLAVDVSTKTTAYALSDNKEILKFGKLKTEEIDKWADLISSCDIFAIEDQYLNPAVSPRSLIKLTFVAGKLVGIAQLLGKKILIIPPKSWQSKILKTKIIQKRVVLKELSKFIASQLVDKKITDHNIADAICLCEYIRQKCLTNLKK